MVLFSYFIVSLFQLRIHYMFIINSIFFFYFVDCGCLNIMAITSFNCFELNFFFSHFLLCFESNLFLISFWNDVTIISGNNNNNSKKNHNSFLCLIILLSMLFFSLHEKIQKKNKIKNKLYLDEVEWQLFLNSFCVCFCFNISSIFIYSYRRNSIVCCSFFIFCFCYLKILGIRDIIFIFLTKSIPFSLDKHKKIWLKKFIFNILFSRTNDLEIITQTWIKFIYVSTLTEWMVCCLCLLRQCVSCIILFHFCFFHFLRLSSTIIIQHNIAIPSKWCHFFFFLFLFLHFVLVERRLKCLFHTILAIT